MQTTVSLQITTQGFYYKSHKWKTRGDGRCKFSTSYQPRTEWILVVLLLRKNTSCMQKINLSLTLMNHSVLKTHNNVRISCPSQYWFPDKDNTHYFTYDKSTVECHQPGMADCTCAKKQKRPVLRNYTVQSVTEPLSLQYTVGLKTNTRITFTRPYT